MSHPSPHRWALALLLTACDRGVATQEPEARRYVRAVEGEGLTVDDRLTLCRGLGSPELAAECVAIVVKDHDGSPSERCALIPEGRWRDECWFHIAERLGPEATPADAVALCQRAGRFFQPCSSHVISQQVLRLAETTPADTRRARVHDLAQAWAQHSSSRTAATDVWRFYWQGEFSAAGAADPRRCAAEPQPRPCEEALAATFRTAHLGLMRAGASRWCAQPLGASVDAALSTWAAPPSATLRTRIEQVATEAWGQTCR